MASVVLTSPPLATNIFGYQFGVYEDIRYWFCMTASLQTSSKHKNNYDGFLQYDMTWCLVVDCYSLHPRDLGLDCNASHDVRLPLHVVIYIGCVATTRRILACRPDLASAEAIDLAFHCGHLMVAAYLLELRRDVPQLGTHWYPYSTTTDDIWPIGEELPSTCAENGDVALLQLLRTYTTIGWKPIVLRNAIRQRRSPVMAKYLYHNVPETHFADALDEAVGWGRLPLVELLHRDGYVCSSRGINAAICRGHLDGIRFLFEHGVAPPRNAIERAVYCKQREILLYLLSLADADLDVDDALATALYGGTVDSVDMLLASGRTMVPQGAVLAALQKRDLNLACCLLSHGGHLDVAAIGADVLRQYTQQSPLLLERLRENGIELPTTSM